MRSTRLVPGFIPGVRLLLVSNICTLHYDNNTIYLLTLSNIHLSSLDTQGNTSMCCDKSKRFPIFGSEWVSTILDTDACSPLKWMFESLKLSSLITSIINNQINWVVWISFPGWDLNQQWTSYVMQKCHHMYKYSVFLKLHNRHQRISYL